MLSTLHWERNNWFPQTHARVWLRQTTFLLCFWAFSTYFQCSYCRDGENIVWSLVTRQLWSADSCWNVCGELKGYATSRSLYYASIINHIRLCKVRFVAKTAESTNAVSNDISDRHTILSCKTLLSAFQAWFGTMARKCWRQTRLVSLRPCEVRCILPA